MWSLRKQRAGTIRRHAKNKPRNRHMSNGDALPFSRTRQRAYDEFTSAITRSAPPSDDYLPSTSSIEVATTHTEPHVSTGGRSLALELASLKHEIRRVQDSISRFKRKSKTHAEGNERPLWTATGRASQKCKQKYLTTQSSQVTCRQPTERRALTVRERSQPNTRQMAIALAQCFHDVLPEGAIEDKYAELNLEESDDSRSRGYSIDDFGSDFSVIDAAFREGARQSSVACKERGELLDDIRERYGELFGVMRNACHRWGRKNNALSVELRALRSSLEMREYEHVALTEYANQCKHKTDLALEWRENDNKRAEAVSERARAKECEMLTLQRIDRAEIRRLRDRIKLLNVEYKQEMATSIAAIEDSLHTALDERDSLSQRVGLLNHQLQRTRLLLPDRASYATMETQTASSGDVVEACENAPVSIVSIGIQTEFVKNQLRCKRGGDSRATPPYEDRKFDKRQQRLGGFASMVHAQKAGRRRPMIWLLKCIAQIYSDKITLDSSGQQDCGSEVAHESALSPLASFVYDWHVQKFGLRQLAEANLLDLIASVEYHAADSSVIQQFAFFCGLPLVEYGKGLKNTPADVPCLDIYLRFLDALSHEGNIIHMLLECGRITSPGNEQSTIRGSLPVSRTFDALKTIFTDFRDNTLAMKEFAQNKLGIKHLTNSSTVQFATLLQRVMEEYTRRRVAALEMLRALFRAADCDEDKNLNVDEFKACLRVANPKMADSVISRAFAQSSRKSSDVDETLIASEEDFIAACLSNGLETFGFLHDRMGTHSKRGTSFECDMEARVEDEESSSASIESRIRALTSNGGTPAVIRCECQLSHLERLKTCGAGKHDVYFAQKLLKHYLHVAAIRVRGGFRRLGNAVLTQVSFSMRAAASAIETIEDDVANDNQVTTRNA